MMMQITVKLNCTKFFLPRQLQFSHHVPRSIDMFHFSPRELMRWFAGAVVFICICVQCAWSQDTIREIKCPSEKFELDRAVPTLIEVPACESSKFSFPYYLYLPSGLPRNAPVRLLVEPNNSADVSDNFAFHRQRAKELATQRYPRQVADELKTPLLVPVFPRPKSRWKIYTQILNRNTLLVEDGDSLYRIDLQLLGMIEDARELLRNLGIETKPRIFMDGFSASGCFVNRFAALHPEVVRALAAGGINGLPIFPMETYQGVSLPFPLGVGDMKSLTGASFDAASYYRVSQYLYMGAIDTNDTFPYSDAWDDDERILIAKLFGCKMMPDRWARSQEILSGLHLPIQTVTYRGVGHDPNPMVYDLVAFFKANEGEVPAEITPHEHSLVPRNP